MSDDYDLVARGSLKLKDNALGVSKKSKKKKKKEKLKEDEQQRELVEKAVDLANNEGPSKSKVDKDSWMTDAQRKFLAQQEKRQLARVMEKATKSHKQRVEEFNTHLENLSEHYDIPKVSWTK